MIMLLFALMQANVVMHENAHVQVDSTVAKQTVAWYNSAAPNPMCVWTHHEFSTLTNDSVWVQDSIERELRNENDMCAPHQGVVVKLTPEQVASGPSQIGPMLAQIGSSLGLPWLCGIVEIKPLEWPDKSMRPSPLEFCAYSAP